MIGFAKSPSAALHRAFLHCDVALLRLVRKSRCALHMELFAVPNKNHQKEKNMKKLALIIAAALAISAPMAAIAAMEHGSMQGMEHMEHKGDVAHEEVVDGVKATFKMISMKEHMKAMKEEMPKGMKETHHLMVTFKDAKSGKVLTEGEVTVKIQAPDKSEQVKDLMGMGGMEGMDAGFGADFELAKKGKYGVMAKFKLKDGKVRSAKFWYTVK